ncbi:hypothetical protein BJ741DRAFT_635085 [Chytriomyces cf. hyalinus JEL632]|nr:hypothetical protein BJ741DRAFT_635085 [Chytriomyces cf. hyalinus JEL632]
MSTAPPLTSSIVATLSKSIPPLSLDVGSACNLDLIYACAWNNQTAKDSIVQCSKGFPISHHLHTSIAIKTGPLYVGVITFVNDCATTSTVRGSGPVCVYMDNSASSLYYLPFCVPGEQPTAPKTVANVHLEQARSFMLPIPSPNSGNFVVASGDVGDVDQTPGLESSITGFPATRLKMSETAGMGWMQWIEICAAVLTLLV